MGNEEKEEEEEEEEEDLTNHCHLDNVSFIVYLIIYAPSDTVAFVDIYFIQKSSFWIGQMRKKT